VLNIKTNYNFKVYLGLIHYETLNLNISASRQNIKNLVNNFGVIHVRIMHANFQVSSFTGVGGGGVGDRRKDGQGTSRCFWPDPYTEFLNSPFASEGKIFQVGNNVLKFSFQNLHLIFHGARQK